MITTTIQPNLQLEHGLVTEALFRIMSLAPTSQCLHPSVSMAAGLLNQEVVLHEIGKPDNKSARANQQMLAMY